MRNICVDAAMTELRAYGHEGRIEPRGKHQAVLWTQDGREMSYTLPSTPSDVRAPLNTRSDIRQLLRSTAPAEIVPTSFDIRIHDDEALTSSRHVAEVFGKEHKNVLRDIDNLLKVLDSSNLSSPPFRASMVPDGSGIARRTYEMTRDGFALLAMGFTGEKAIRFKVAFLAAFNAMERAVSQGALGRELADDRSRIARLEGELSALTDLFLDAPRQKVKKPPFVRPSVRRRMKRMGLA